MACEYRIEYTIQRAVEGTDELALAITPDVALAARDRRVAAEALRKASSLTTDADRVFHNSDDVRDWLRARADQIEKGEVL